MRHHTRSSLLLKDVFVVFVSILVAIFLVKTNILGQLLTSTLHLELLGSFIAGMFFTSFFTTAPAIVTLGEIAGHNSIWLTALFGATGAVIGDAIIFRFIRDRLSEHLLEIIKHEKPWRKIRALFRLRYFRWGTFLFGGLIIASPLPDELGIGLLGFSKMKMTLFIPVSFFFNFVGILVIGLLARAF